MTSTENRVQLVMPASAEYVVLARLTAASIAGRIGMSFDDIEDLRVVAAEVCRLAVGENGSSGTLTLNYTATAEGLEIEAVGQVQPVPAAPDDDDLSVVLITALTDEHDVEVGNAEVRVRVVKRIG